MVSRGELAAIGCRCSCMLQLHRKRRGVRFALRRNLGRTRGAPNAMRSTVISHVIRRRVIRHRTIVNMAYHRRADAIDGAVIKERAPILSNLRRNPNRYSQSRN